MNTKPGARAVPNVEIKGLKQVTRRLADGRRVTYWYAWAGGPRLAGKPGSPEFFASYKDALESRQQNATGTVAGLAGEFRASAEFGKLAAKTKQAYLFYLRMIENEFGDMPLRLVEDRRARGDFLAWRDTMQANPRKADYAWTTLNRLFSFAKDRGRIPVNPCERGGKLYEADRTEKIWTAPDFDRLFAVCSPQIRQAVSLAVLTAQRQGDVLGLAWTRIASGELRLRQSKTSRLVAIALYPELQALLDSIPKRATTILTNSDGRPWTVDGFKSSFRKACIRAGIDGLTFHDLRGTAITHFAMRGMRALEVATVAGLSEKDVSAMLDRHYLGERAEIARAAVRRCLAAESGTVFGKRQENEA
jgi:integrase